MARLVYNRLVELVPNSRCYNLKIFRVDWWIKSCIKVNIKEFNKVPDKKCLPYIC